MKYILSFFALFFVYFSFFWDISNANSIFDNSTNQIPYCNNPWECWLNEWVNAVKDIDALETTRTASQYVQSVVKYILWFLAMIATFIIIYAWFNLLTSIWDEEKAKKSKQIIMYAIWWIFVIYIAGPLIDFVIKIFYTQ